MRSSPPHYLSMERLIIKHGDSQRPMCSVGRYKGLGGIWRKDHTTETPCCLRQAAYYEGVVSDVSELPERGTPYCAKHSPMRIEFNKKKQQEAESRRLRENIEQNLSPSLARRILRKMGF